MPFSISSLRSRLGGDTRYHIPTIERNPRISSMITPLRYTIPSHLSFQNHLQNHYQNQNNSLVFSSSHQAPNTPITITVLQLSAQGSNDDGFRSLTKQVLPSSNRNAHTLPRFQFPLPSSQLRPHGSRPKLNNFYIFQWYGHCHPPGTLLLFTPTSLCLLHT